MKICIITSTRADFGLLKNLIFKIKKNKIISAIKKLLSNGFQKSLKSSINLYGRSGASELIVKVLKKIETKKLLTRFFLILIKFKNRP